MNTEVEWSEMKVEANGQEEVQNQETVDEKRDQNAIRGFGGRGRYRGNRRHDKIEGQEPGGGGYSRGGGRGGGVGRGGGRFRGGQGMNTGGDQPHLWSNDTDFLNDRLQKIFGGTSTIELPSPEFVEKKFTSRCRLYVGNLPSELTEEELKEIFVAYGETSELYISKEKHFAFIRLDYRSSAEKAKTELDGHSLKGRSLRVRFAPLGATVKVKNLTPYVTIELLDKAFTVFGEVERTTINVDDRGNSLKEGIVEFTRKSSAQTALRLCSDGCFFLTSSLRPVILEHYELSEENFNERCITKKGPDFFEAREVGPRFAKPDSFDYQFGTRWKQIYELYRQKEEALKKELKLEEEKLEAQLQYAKYEHETEMLREQLRQKEMDRERQKREWELKERQAAEQKLVEEETLRRQQEEMSRRMLHQEDELRRRHQENNLLMQAGSNEVGVGFGFGGYQVQQLSGLLCMEQVSPSEARSNSYTTPTETSALDTFQYDGQRKGTETNFLDMSYNRSGLEAGGARTEMEDMASRRSTGGRWAHQERRPPNEDFSTKRRRY